MSRKSKAPPNPGRESMTPPDSGRPYRPGQDCPSCGAALTADAGKRVCSDGCGYWLAVVQ